jgi:hypothetical protein
VSMSAEQADSLGESLVLEGVDLHDAIDATGFSVLITRDERRCLVIQNRGTVPVEVYYTADGSGEAFCILAGGDAEDDGVGRLWADEYWRGPVWLKCAATGGRASVAAY